MVDIYSISNFSYKVDLGTNLFNMDPWTAEYWILFSPWIFWTTFSNTNCFFDLDFSYVGSIHISGQSRKRTNRRTTLDITNFDTCDVGTFFNAVGQLNNKIEETADENAHYLQQYVSAMVP